MTKPSAAARTLPLSEPAPLEEPEKPPRKRRKPRTDLLWKPDRGERVWLSSGGHVLRRRDDGAWELSKGGAVLGVYPRMLDASVAAERPIVDVIVSTDGTPKCATLAEHEAAIERYLADGYVIADEVTTAARCWTRLRHPERREEREVEWKP